MAVLVLCCMYAWPIDFFISLPIIQCLCTPRFNWPAKKLYKRLMQLGAVPFYEPAYADDQHYLGLVTSPLSPLSVKFSSHRHQSLLPPIPALTLDIRILIDSSSLSDTNDK